MKDGKEDEENPESSEDGMERDSAQTQTAIRTATSPS